MGYMSSVFSFMFFISGLISIYLGIYIIMLNPKKRVNRAFLSLCISLSIWSVGFAFGNSAKTLNMAIFWRRFAAIGWTLIVSLTLHFLLLLTQEELSKNQERFFFLLHIPALINMYVFSISSKISIGQYRLVQNPYGWTNMTVNNGWDYMYYFYYSIYMILGLTALLRWRKRIDSKIKIRQANLIFASILGGVLVASITDITLSTFLSSPLPQMAPLAILIPTWAMYHSARYYDLINYKKSHIDEIIATNNDKKKMFYNIAIGLYISGIFNMIFEYSKFIGNSGHNLKLGIIKTIMFFIIGTIIYLIQGIKKDNLRENLTILVLVSNIPIITFNFFEYAGMTVWVFPIIIIIASLIFTKKTLLISTTVVAIATQGLMWILKPQSTVFVNGYDYMLRIIIFALACIVGFYVNKMYVDKIKENDYQMRFQKMHAEISTQFITSNQENIDEKIDNLLSKIGSFFEVDRVYLFLIDEKNNTMKYSNEWCNKGMKSQVDNKQEISLEKYAWWIAQLKEKGFVYIEDINNMPNEAKNEKEQLIKLKAKSLISVPIEGKDNIKGFVGIQCVSSFKNSTIENVAFLTILSNLLSEALIKVEIEKDIELMAYYDNLTGLANRFLFKDRVKSSISLA